MKKRVIAVLLILVLLLIPFVTGVFAEPDSEGDEVAAPETVEASAEEEPAVSEETERIPEETDPFEETDPAVESEAPTVPEESEEPSVPSEAETFTDFVLDTEPTETAPGRESSHGINDPTIVRYRYFWQVRIYSMDDESFTTVKAYILAADGTEIFDRERTDEVRALLKQPTEPTRSHGTFEGWYTNPAFAEDSAFVFTEETVITGHLELYAKWSMDEGTIIIRRSLDKNEKQSFWYTVEGNDGSYIRVAIPAGKSSVTVSGARYGVTYTVTEQTEWSWRFLCKKNAQTVILTDTESSKTVTFEGKKSVMKWLNSIAQLIQTIG